LNRPAKSSTGADARRDSNCRIPGDPSEWKNAVSQLESPEVQQTPALFVVTGAGPVGWTVAEQLAVAGHRVRVLTRSGGGPDHPLIERKAVDVSDAAQLGGLFRGAQAAFHCIHGSNYSAKVWAAELPGAEQAVLAAAGEAGAVVVFPERLYSYSEPDRPMTEEGPREAQGGKRGVRTALLKARTASATDTVSVVAGDFFGPRVRMSHAGERMVRPVAAGKPMQVVGRADQPHMEPGVACAYRTCADPARACGGIRQGSRRPGPACHSDTRLGTEGDDGVLP
jgi:nucleoside-diphosphate-sugar epimerase